MLIYIYIYTHTYSSPLSHLPPAPSKVRLLPLGHYLDTTDVI